MWTNGMQTILRYFYDVRKLIRERNLPFRCDAPTEALGNCFPYAIMQQLHRPEVWMSLTEDIKLVSQNCHLLRQGIVDFVQNISPISDYFELVNESRTTYMQIAEASTDGIPNWQCRLNKMSTDQHWFDDQFMQFCSYYLKHDIICYTNSNPIKFCCSP